MTDASHDYYNLQNLDPAHVALYNVGRLRTDIWHFLRDSARRLRRIHNDPKFADDTMWLTTACGEVFDFLRPLEDYFAFPGVTALEQLRSNLDHGLFDDLARQTLRLVRMMNNESYRRLDLASSQLKDYADLLNVAKLSEEVHIRIRQERRLYFEALVVDDLSRAEAKELRAQARSLRRPDDAFLYESVVASTFEDALIAVLMNPNIQICLIRYSFPFRTNKKLKLIAEIYTILGIDPAEMESLSGTERSLYLGSMLKALRPELDIFMVTDAPVEDVVGQPSRDFRRIFYLQENYREVHLSALKSIHERFETPFFNALRRYSQKPTGMFHALPISHSATIWRAAVHAVWYGLADLQHAVLLEIHERAETASGEHGKDHVAECCGAVQDRRACNVIDTMNARLRSIAEPTPGDKWKTLFQQFWPNYQKWFLKEGANRRPTFLACESALRQHMPELLPTYERLVELAGGGDLEARFLSLYQPTPYLTGCSQAVWTRDQPQLIRNYDYDPKMWEGVLLHSSWNGRKVIAMSDCLWGVLDGFNDAGLAVSLAFGGRKAVGDGFGIPLILRYILEFCDTTHQAEKVLARVPSHMSYNVTLLDAGGRHRTAFVAPDRVPVITNKRLATNHQEQVEWYEHAVATGSVDRAHFLALRLDDSRETGERFASRFLEPPLYSTRFDHGWGTLYTAVYDPTDRTAIYRWPGFQLQQSFSDFSETFLDIQYRSK